MRQAIIERIRDILETLTPVAGTNLTVAPRTPEMMQNFEGYVFVVRPTGLSWQYVTQDMRQGVMTVDVSIYSPEVRLGLHAQHEDYILAYADSVFALLDNKTRLELSGEALNNITRSVVTGERLTAPAPYPDGQSNIMRYRYAFTLSVEIIQPVVC